MKKSLMFLSAALLAAGVAFPDGAAAQGYGGGYGGPGIGQTEVQRETPEERRARYLKLAGINREKSETVLVEAEAKAAEYRAEAAAAREKAEADAAADPKRADSLRAKAEKSAARLEERANSTLEKAKAKSESYKKKAEDYLQKAAESR